MAGSFFAMFLYLTLYIQDVLGYSPLQAGLRFLPTTLLSFAVAPIAGRLSVRVPVRLLLGSGLLLIGAGLLAMTTLDAASGWTVLIPGFILAGAGVGLVNPPLASTAIGVVPNERSGMASGSTRPSARSASPRGSPGWAPSSSTASGTAPSPRSAQAGTRARSSPPPTASSARCSSPAKHPFARSLPSAAHTALVHSYRVGFTGHSRRSP